MHQRIGLDAKERLNLQLPFIVADKCSQYAQTPQHMSDVINMSIHFHFQDVYTLEQYCILQRVANIFLYNV